MNLRSGKNLSEQNKIAIKPLSYTTEVIARFNEADPLGIVWHGHYIRYFEDGREAFGKEHGIAYMDFYKHGLAVPIVSVHCDFKKPLKFGDTMIVETIYHDSPAAKIMFDYKVFQKKTGDLVASGSTVQVFVDVKTFQLQLTMPEFFENWKERMKVK